MADCAHRWRPSAFLQASAALHIGAAVAAVASPQTWPVGIASVVANQLAITALGLWPRSTLLGTNVRRLPARPECAEIAITIDDGVDAEVTPRVLDILEHYAAKATFFVIANTLRRHPDMAHRIIRAGHCIENHSMTHRHTFALRGMRGMRCEIETAQQVIADVTGRMPRYFRAPAGLRNPFLDPVLHALDLTLVSWSRRGFDTRETDAQRVARRLLHGLQARDILLLHDGNAAHTAQGQPVILAVLPHLLRAAQKQGLHCVTLEHGLRAPSNNPYESSVYAGT